LFERGIQNHRRGLCFRIKGGKEEMIQMKKAIVIVMLIMAMGLVGCPRNYYDPDRDYGGHDRGHDYEHHDRDNQDHGDHR